MKKIFLTILALIITTPFAHAAYQVTERVDVLSYDTSAQNIVIKRQNDDRQWLVHYKGRCGDYITDETKPVISIQGELDGRNDYIKINYNQRCELNQAEVITNKLTVGMVYDGNTNALLTDENGYQYYVSYGSECRGLRNFRTVYAEQAGKFLNEGDRIYIPDNIGQCNLLYVEKVADDSENLQPEPPETDTQKPTKVYGVTAVAADESVYLTWKEAKDNVGIDHYIVSYYRYSINTEDYDLAGMPNKTEVKGTNYKVTGLENGRTYYFYVAAADAEGNISDEWSSEVKATPKSLTVAAGESSGSAELNLRQTQETAKSFFFRWDRIPGFQRQMVTLDADGQREFGHINSNKNYIRVFKRSSREGKKLKLTVRAFTIRGDMYEEKIVFSY